MPARLERLACARGVDSRTDLRMDHVSGPEQRSGPTLDPHEATLPFLGPPALRESRLASDLLEEPTVVIATLVAPTRAVLAGPCHIFQPPQLLDRTAHALSLSVSRSTCAVSSSDGSSSTQEASGAALAVREMRPEKIMHFSPTRIGVVGTPFPNSFTSRGTPSLASLRPGGREWNTCFHDHGQTRGPVVSRPPPRPPRPRCLATSLRLLSAPLDPCCAFQAPDALRPHLSPAFRLLCSLAGAVLHLAVFLLHLLAHSGASPCVCARRAAWRPRRRPPRALLRGGRRAPGARLPGRGVAGEPRERPGEAAAALAGALLLGACGAGRGMHAHERARGQ